MRSSPFNRDHTKVMISVGFLAVFALMLLVAYQSINTLNRVNDSMAELIHNNDQKTSFAYQMRDVIRLRSSEVRSLAQTLAPEEREKVFEKLIQSTETYNKARSQLEALGANAREQEVLTKISEADARAQEAYSKAGERIYSVTNNTDALKTALGNVQLRELVLLNHLNGLVQLERELSTEALAGNQARYKKTRQWLLASVVAAFIVSIIISVAVINRVTSANRRIKHLANHDDLTGLNNRRSFEEALLKTIQNSKRSPLTYGLMYLDFDRFKIVNDSCGHHAGDQLLIQISQLIKERLSGHDLFARVGGDEFAIITQAHSLDEVAQIAEDIREITQDFAFEFQSQVFKISVSIGVLPITGEETNIEVLLQNVDSACYVAKQQGRNRVHLADQSDTEVVQYRADIAGMHYIRHALDKNLLSLYYQPVHKINAVGTEMAHCEILLRIIDDDGNVISPAAFIPIAEKYNMMGEIDRWVVSNVMQWVAQHQGTKNIPRFLINLSGLSFIDENFLDFVVFELENSGVNPENIAFEITETAAVDNVEQANAFIARLKSLGCRFALDDFGTGFSTFAYLKSLPIDYLKIDGSLVKNITTDSVDKGMVRAINEISHTVGARTIAEFVENDAIVDVLRELGVEYAQGFGLQMPGPIDHLLEQLPDNDEPEIQWQQAS